MPTHHLGGDQWMWECPTLGIPKNAWATVDLFWMCYSCTPSQSGAVLRRDNYPHPGALFEQDNWIMWAFNVIEYAFYSFQVDVQKERSHVASLRQAHHNINSASGSV